MPDDPTNDDDKVLSNDELDQITGGGNPGGDPGGPEPGPYADPEPEGGVGHNVRRGRHK